MLEGSERRMRGVGHLLVARVVLSLVVFGVALALQTRGRGLPEAAEQGLYATLAFALIVTGVCAGLFWRVRNRERFGAIQVAIDISIVTALVHFSGGGDSLFTFLYLVVIAYAAMLFDRRLAMAAACVGAGAYAGILLGAQRGWLPDYGAAEMSLANVVTLAGVQGGALLLVAFLSSELSRQLQSAGRALDQRTRALGRLQRLHERIVESLLSGLLTVDLEGAITSFNQEAERITGARLEQVRGRPLEEVIPGIAGLIASGRSETGDGVRVRRRIAYRNRRGQDLYLGIAASILRDADGGPSGHVMIFQDVTPVVRMEHELRRSERLAAVGELSAALAHEVRNPLAAMSGAIQILQSHGRGDEAREERRRLMGIVLRETDRLDRLITDFLQYARPAPVAPEPVRVTDVIEETLKMVEASHPTNLEIVRRLSPSLMALADPGQLRQLLWNLVLNAVQAMPEGGRLVVGARAVDESPAQAGGIEDREAEEKEASAWVEIAVSDSGVGIEPETIERIFDPFFTTKRNGTGLGLATVHRLIEANHGTLSVESKPGVGSRFQVRLPRSEGGS